MSLVDLAENGFMFLDFKDNCPVMLISELSDLDLGPVVPVVLSVLLGVGVEEAANAVHIGVRRGYPGLAPADDGDSGQDGEKANAEEGDHLGPEHPVADIVLPAGAPEDDADDADDDDQAGYRTIGAVDFAELSQALAFDARSQQGELGGEDGDQREHRQMVGDSEDEIEVEHFENSSRLARG